MSLETPQEVVFFRGKRSSRRPVASFAFTRPVFRGSSHARGKQPTEVKGNEVLLKHNIRV